MTTSIDVKMLIEFGTSDMMCVELSAENLPPAVNVFVYIKLMLFLIPTKLTIDCYLRYENKGYWFMISSISHIKFPSKSEVEYVKLGE